MTSNLHLPKTSDSIAGKIAELRATGSHSKSRWKELQTEGVIEKNQSCKPKLVPISFLEDNTRDGVGIYRKMDERVFEAMKGMTLLKLKVQKYKKRLNTLMTVMKNKDLEISRLKRKVESLEGGQNPTAINTLSEEMVTLVDTVENLGDRLFELEGIVKKILPSRSDKYKLSDAISDSSNEDIEDSCKISRLCDESFDLIISQIKEMNQEAGEIHVYHSTQTGATFQRCNRLSLTLYANGFSIEGCQFRRYSERSAQQFIKDIVDGFYPSEFQTRFPRGVVLNVNDKRTVHFNGSIVYNHASFKGKGLRLNSDGEEESNSESSPKCDSDINTNLRKLCFTGFDGDSDNWKNVNSCSYRDFKTNINHGTSHETSFCDTTIKNGEIYRKEKTENEFPHRLTTEYLNKIKENTSSTVQLKIVSSVDRNCLFMLTMDTSQTISELQSYLPEDLRHQKIMFYKDSCKSTILEDYSKTLKDYGIEENYLLIFRKV